MADASLSAFPSAYPCGGEKAGIGGLDSVTATPGGLHQLVESSAQDGHLLAEGLDLDAGSGEADNGSRSVATIPPVRN